MADQHRFIPRGGDDYGTPQRDVSADHPPPDDKGPITEVWVLVCTHENGSEAVYGQMLPGIGMTNFVTESVERRQMLDSLLLQQGTYEVCKRLGKKLTWKVYTLDGP